MDQDQVTDELLARHVAGETSLDEDGAVARWVEASDVNRIAYERLLETSSTFSAPLARSRLVDVIPVRRDSTWRESTLKLVAAIAVLAGVAYFAMQPSLARERHYATGPDERLQIELRDGSRVVLAPNSSLTVLSDYNREHRNVTLAGAAWFSAVHDDDFAFKVSTHRAVIVDIGTTFSVEERSPARLEVGVIEGKILVQAYGLFAGPELVAGQVAVVTPETVGTIPNVTILSGLPVDSLDRWHHDVLDVTDVPVSTALAELADWYGVDIALADTTLSVRPITATLSLTSLDAALDVVAKMLDVTAVKDSASRTPRVVLR